MADIYENYEFLINYFTQAINNPDKNLSHCILFWGNDIDAQYELAKEIARLLNCKEDKSRNCTCRNCNWIRDDKHPAVLTYSRMDNKPSDDTTKNVISIAQARTIKNDLLITSDYHRVYIFCDRDDNNNLLPLNYDNFQPAAANALLKTFEEPPSNTTFIFLTNDVTDLLDTIVSRTQSFYVPSKTPQNLEYNLVQDVLNNYFELNQDEMLDFGNELYKLTKDNGANTVFNQMQNYMLNLMKTNLNNNKLQIKLQNDINFVETAKKQHKVGINLQTITETLAFNLVLN